MDMYLHVLKVITFCYIDNTVTGHVVLTKDDMAKFHMKTTVKSLI